MSTARVWARRYSKRLPLRGGHFVYRHARTRAVDMPAAMPICSYGTARRRAIQVASAPPVSCGLRSHWPMMKSIRAASKHGLHRYGRYRCGLCSRGLCSRDSTYFFALFLLRRGQHHRRPLPLQRRHYRQLRRARPMCAELRNG